MTERIDREVVVPAAPEEVWHVVTGDGWLADEVKLDLVPGGEASFADGSEVRTGWVEEAQPPCLGEGGRLAFWWSSDDDPASRVELALDPVEADHTLLRISETRPLEVLDIVGIPLPGPGGPSYGPAMLAVA